MNKYFIALQLILLTILGPGQTAFAHMPESSEYYIDKTAEGFLIKAYFPVDRIDYALSVSLGADEDFSTLVMRTLFIRQLNQHLWLTDEDGRRITGKLLSTRRVIKDQQGTQTPMIEAGLLFLTRSETGGLYSDLITHAVSNHDVYVIWRHNFRQGVIRQPELIGVITKANPSLVLTRHQGGLWQGILSVFYTGMSHIAQGTDHLLFLFCLLLTAPVKIKNGRWQGRLSDHKAFGQIFRLVTAFTTGHTITLVMATLGWIPVGGKWIEVMIAVTIICSALLAIRPLLVDGSRGQVWLAGLFGLIHGAAFAEVMSGLGVKGLDMAAALVAFTTGIEVMQLFLVILVMPCLLILSRAGWFYRYFRIVLAFVGMIAAFGWLLERVEEQNNYLTRQLEYLTEIAPYFYAALMLMTLLMWFVLKKDKVQPLKPGNRDAEP